MTRSMADKVLPDTLKAEGHRRMAEPGSAGRQARPARTSSTRSTLSPHTGRDTQ